MKKYKLLFFFCLITTIVSAQQTFPVNGVHDYREGYVAFTHANIVKDSKTTLKEGLAIVIEFQMSFAALKVSSVDALSTRIISHCEVGIILCIAKCSRVGLNLELLLKQQIITLIPSST